MKTESHSRINPDININVVDGALITSHQAARGTKMMSAARKRQLRAASGLTEEEIASIRRKLMLVE